ncbi:hypothetical protein BD311DRAFT_809615 [Dichomitus squalens]|uniref:Uncharacterized protein n=1 Tax=Dichomitus squalens TaxID=114155 RepID=A0A4Q9MGF8_9APHY|nr:hypothetical protein BD311DRAFT_809615 [Dichomitus squalens]
MTREELGFDSTADIAKDYIVAELRAWASSLRSTYLRKQAPGAMNKISEEWPTHELTFQGRTLYVGKPTFASPSLYSRCTRGYCAMEKVTGIDGVIAYHLRGPLQKGWTGYY